MSNCRKLVIFLGLFAICSLLSVDFSLAKNQIDLYFFYGQGCPYCAQMSQVLKEIQEKYSQLKINALEVWYNQNNQKLLTAMSEAYKIKPEGVPVIFIGEQAIEGAGAGEIFQVKEAVRVCSISDCSSPIKKIKTIPAKTLNFKNIALFLGGLVIFLIITLSFFKKKK